MTFNLGTFLMFVVGGYYVTKYLKSREEAEAQAIPVLDQVKAVVNGYKVPKLADTRPTAPPPPTAPVATVTPIPQVPMEATRPTTPLQRQQLQSSKVMSALTQQELNKITDPETKLRATMNALWEGRLTMGSGWAPYQVAHQVVQMMLAKIPAEYKQQFYQERLGIYRQGAIATSDPRYIELDKVWFEKVLTIHKQCGIEIPNVVNIGCGPQVRYEAEIRERMKAFVEARGGDWSTASQYLG